jgi:hypothetical protein
VIAWHLLTRNQPYTDLGADYFLERQHSEAYRSSAAVSTCNASASKVTPRLPASAQAGASATTPDSSYHGHLTAPVGSRP